VPATGSPPRPGRRRFLSAAASVAATAAGVGFGYALAVEPRWFGITRRTLPIRDLPPELDGLRLVQLTDIHHGPWLSLDYVRQVVDAANDLEPDLVLLTGDYVAESSRYIPPVMDELARLRPKIGCVAVRGNHDWSEGGPLTQRELARIGVPLLDNTRLVLTPERRLSGDSPVGLALCGVGDLWKDSQDYRAALGGLPDDMPRLLLSHNPDVAEEPAFRSCGLRVDLMVSGHTHGGQVAIPFMGTPVVPSKYGQKYASGMVQGPTCPVFVCRGIGLSVMPVRMGVSPEIAVLELRAG
jgi:predicted MPP superfamily phosphohydrolase